MMDKKEARGVFCGTSDANMKLLQSYMDYASNIRHGKLPRSEVLKPHLDFSGKEKNCCGSNKESVALSTENSEQRPNGVLGAMANSNSIVGSDEFPLLTKDVVMRMDHVDERPKKSCGLVFVNRVLKYRPSFYVIALIAVCFGVCAIVLHPHKTRRPSLDHRLCTPVLHW
ncbi:hypothetical protein OIU78_007713 [Salix suchowensis]|nr:hypothetical protein OIU78_007713 [Salix suchowensis]